MRISHIEDTTISSLSHNFTEKVFRVALSSNNFQMSPLQKWGRGQEKELIMSTEVGKIFLTFST